MPQIFQVLKCYKCLVFQVHQTKKSNKFECKMCGEKQSIKRHYGIGTGKDCRLHVQKLNGIRGEMEETSTQSNSDNEFEGNTDAYNADNRKNISNNSIKRSRWSEFVDKEETTEDTANEPMFLGDKEVILEMPQKKKPKKFKVKTNILSPSEDKLKVSYNTPSFAPDSSLRVNAFNDFETKDIVKSIHNSDQKYIDGKIQSNSLLNKHYPSNYNKQKPPLEVEVLNPTSRNSKWEQFVDTEDEGKKDENEDMNRVIMPILECDKYMSKTQSLFSLGDDSDIDNLLDF